MRASMKRDADRHRNRLIPHTLALIVSAPVAIVPGPNVLGYLFTFTVVGHFLAWRGAVNALHQIAWTIVPNPALTDVRRAFSLEAAARHRLIREVATACTCLGWPGSSSRWPTRPEPGQTLVIFSIS